MTSIRPPKNLTSKTIGLVAYVRFLRNNGVSFDTAYFMTFGTMPRR